MASRRDLANAIRALSMDAVQQANSGHPGAPMGMADIAEVLWNDYLRHNPADPDWVNRDRFGYASWYAVLAVFVGLSSLLTSCTYTIVALLVPFSPCPRLR